MWSINRLLSEANDAAGGTGARVACLLGLLVAALAEVVGARVGDDGALVGEYVRWFESLSEDGSF
jgi:hypothetical protein